MSARTRNPCFVRLMASPCASYALQLEGRYDYYAIPIAKSGAFRTALAQHTALARRGLGENCGGAVPVHPRDLLSGHYVALRYLIASPSRQREPRLQPREKSKPHSGPSKLAYPAHESEGEALRRGQAEQGEDQHFSALLRTNLCGDDEEDPVDGNRQDLDREHALGAHLDVKKEQDQCDFE